MSSGQYGLVVGDKFAKNFRVLGKRSVSGWSGCVG